MIPQLMPSCATKAMRSSQSGISEDTDLGEGSAQVLYIYVCKYSHWSGSGRGCQVSLELE